ncbi:hypothetical protein BGW39_004443 [Mortierella sp. 14UC]|nr:hypothetical protein BGW39_004443 [Mortierella sp. 14UC]
MAHPSAISPYGVSTTNNTTGYPLPSSVPTTSLLPELPVNFAFPSQEDILNTPMLNYDINMPTPIITPGVGQAQEECQNQPHLQCGDYLNVLFDFHNQDLSNLPNTTTTPLESGNQDLYMDLEIANIGGAAWTNVPSGNQDGVMQAPVLPSQNQALDLSIPPTSILPFKQQIDMSLFMDSSLLGVQGGLNATGSILSSSSSGGMIGAGAFGTNTNNLGSLGQQPLLLHQYPTQQHLLSHNALAANDYGMVHQQPQQQQMQQQQRQQQQVASLTPLAASLPSPVGQYNLQNQVPLYHQQQQKLLQQQRVQAQVHRQNQFYGQANVAASSSSRNISVSGQNDYHPSATYMDNPHVGSTIPGAASNHISYNRGSASCSYPPTCGPITYLPMVPGPSHHHQHQYRQAIAQQQQQQLEQQRQKATSRRRISSGQGMSTQDQVAAASIEIEKAQSKLRRKKQEEYRQASAGAVAAQSDSHQVSPDQASALISSSNANTSSCQTASTSRVENSSGNSSLQQQSQQAQLQQPQQQYSTPSTQSSNAPAVTNQGFHQQAVESASSSSIPALPSTGSQALNLKETSSNSQGRVALSHTQAQSQGRGGNSQIPSSSPSLTSAFSSTALSSQPPSHPSGNSSTTTNNNNQQLQQQQQQQEEQQMQQQLLDPSQQQQQLTMNFSQQLDQLNNALHQQMQQFNKERDQQLQQQQQQEEEEVGNNILTLVNMTTPAGTTLQPTAVASGSGSGSAPTPAPNPAATQTSPVHPFAPSSAHQTNSAHHQMLNELSINPQDAFETRTTWATNMYSIYGSTPPRPTDDYYRFNPQPRPFFRAATPAAAVAALSAARLADAQIRVSLGPMATAHPSIVNQRRHLGDEGEEQEVVVKAEDPEDTTLSMNAIPRLAQQLQPWTGIELPVAGGSGTGTGNAADLFRAQLADTAAAAIAPQNGEYSTSNGRPPNNLAVPPILTTIPAVAAATTDRRRNRTSARPAPIITAATGGPLSCSLPHCPRTFPTIGLLKSHMVSHNDQKPYWCDTCSIDGIHPRPISPSQLHPGLPVPIPEVKRYKRHHDLLRHKREQHPPVEVKVQRYNEKQAAKEERKKRAEENRKQKALLKRLAKGGGVSRRRKASGSSPAASSSRRRRTSSNTGASSSHRASSNAPASTPGVNDPVAPGDPSASGAPAALGDPSFTPGVRLSPPGSPTVMITLPRQAFRDIQRAHSNSNASTSSAAAEAPKSPRKRRSTNLQRISEEGDAEIEQDYQDPRPKKISRSNSTSAAVTSTTNTYTDTNAIPLQALNEYTFADICENNDGDPSSSSAYQPIPTAQEWKSDEFEETEQEH